jgi:tail tape-measure protein
MSILGSLIVELKASTASFIDGMGGAAKTAKTAGREIEDSFSSLGGFIGKALAPLGEMGSVIGETFVQIGEHAGGAIQSFGKLGGGMSLVAGAGAGVVAAVGAAGAAAIGLATHMAGSAAEMYEMSQATGVSIETLSGFEYVAKQSGVSSEAMTKGLEKLSKSIFTAATAAPGTVNAFTRLGVSVRDSEGNIRDAGAVMTDLAGKFAAMQDGSVKTALAIQLFGRGGAALVPLLNEGKEGIAGWIEEARALGIVLDDQTGEASHRFEQSLNTIKAAGEGMALTLLKDMLPALQSVATALTEGLKDKSSQLHLLVDGFAFIAKVVLATGDTIWTVLKQLGIAIGNWWAAVLEGGTAVYNVLAKGITGDFSGAYNAARDGYTRLKAIGKNFLDDSKKDWGDYAKFTAGLVAPLPKGEKPKPPGGGVDTSAAGGKVDSRLAAINKIIDALKAQTAAELDLAGATMQSVAAQNLLKAAGEANEIVTRLTAEANKTTGAEHAKLIAKIKEETATIYALTAEKQVAKDAVAIDTELGKETLAYDRQVAALHAMASAYEQGGSAIAAAAIEEKLEADRQKVEQLQEEYTRLEGVQGVSADALAKVSAALAQANTALDEHRKQLTEIRAAGYDVELNKQADAMRGSAPLLLRLNDAYSQNAEAVRQAEVALQVYNWQLAHPGADPAQVKAITDQIDEQSRRNRDQQTAQQAAQFSINALYDAQIGQLSRVREAMRGHGQNTILIDAAIFDAQDRLIQQWDDAAFKVGTFGEKFHGVMNEVVVQGREAGAEIMRSIVGAIDEAETQLAKLFTGQKTNFKSLFTGLAESITKSEIKSGLGALFGKLGFGSIPGLTARADGSQSNPYYVVVTNGPGGVIGEAAGAVGGAVGGFGKLIGGFLGAFGGAKAGGGDLSPGRWYIAGERGPEIIAPKTAGVAVPMGRGSSTQIVNNFNGVRDVDMFRRSENQIMAQFHRQSAIAYGRA